MHIVHPLCVSMGPTFTIHKNDTIIFSTCYSLAIAIFCEEHVFIACTPCNPRHIYIIYVVFLVDWAQG